MSDKTACPILRFLEFTTGKLRPIFNCYEAIQSGTMFEAKISISKFINSVECALGLMVVALNVLWPLIAMVRGIEIDCYLATFEFLLMFGTVCFGVYLRVRLKLQASAKLFITMGFLIALLSGAMNLIYLRFPVDTLWLDPILDAADSAIGYDWLTFVVWLSENPKIANTLGFIYISSLFQIVFMAAVLSLTGRDRTLYRMLLTAFVALFATVAIWIIAPSFGPAIFYTLPPEAEAKFQLVNNSRFKSEVWHLVTDGAGTVPPTPKLGLIAFPSYHTVMLLLVLVYAWDTPVRWPVVVVNIPMLPAILGQGAHYVADVVAGVLVFIAAAWMSRQKIVGPETWPVSFGTENEQEFPIFPLGRPPK